MVEKQFRSWFERKPGTKWGPFESDEAVDDAVRRLKNNGGPVELWNFRDGLWSRSIRLDTAGGRGNLATRLRNNQVGQAERVRYDNGAVLKVHRMRDVALFDKPHDWDCLEPLTREFFELCKTIDPQGRYGGGCVCRRASHNASIWSTHAYGEAIDWFRSSMAKGDEIRDAMVRRFGSRCACVWRTAAHFDHLHLEVRPSRSGERRAC